MLCRPSFIDHIILVYTSHRYSLLILKTSQLPICPCKFPQKLLISFVVFSFLLLFRAWREFESNIIWNANIIMESHLVVCMPYTAKDKLYVEDVLWNSSSKRTVEYNTNIYHDSVINDDAKLTNHMIYSFSVCNYSFCHRSTVFSLNKLFCPISTDSLEQNKNRMKIEKRIFRLPKLYINSLLQIQNNRNEHIHDRWRQNNEK